MSPELKTKHPKVHSKRCYKMHKNQKKKEKIIV